MNAYCNGSIRKNDYMLWLKCFRWYITTKKLQKTARVVSENVGNGKVQAQHFIICGRHVRKQENSENKKNKKIHEKTQTVLIFKSAMDP